MYFRYCESSPINKKNEPQIYLDYKDDSKSNNLSKLNFLDFFDNVSNIHLLIKELDKIMEYAEKLSFDYINNKIWLKYQIAREISIPKIGKKTTKMIISINSKAKSKKITAQYIQNKKNKEFIYSDPTTFLSSNPNLFEKQAINENSTFRTTTIKEANFKNYTELLYIFLECLFNSNVNYYIKKCEREHCKKYYIAIKPDTHYCKRTTKIKNNLVPCANIISFIEKTNEYKIFKKDDKNFRNKFGQYKDLPYDYETKYLKKFGSIKDECFRTLNLNILVDFVKNYEIDHPYKK